MSTALKPRLAETDDNEEQDVVPSGLDIKIRLMEKKDCDIILDMVYNLIYMSTGKSIARDLIQQVDFLCFLMLTSLAVYYHTDSFLWANVCFMSLPFAGYMYLAFWIGWKKFYAGEDTKKGADFYEYWSNHDDGHYMFVAEYQGKVIGFVGAFNTSDTSATVARMVTHVDYRGQKVAQRLLLALLLNCKSRGIEDVDLLTAYKHVAAQKLYLKFGFKKIEDIELGTRPFFVFKEFKYHLNVEECNWLS